MHMSEDFLPLLNLDLKQAGVSLFETCSWKSGNYQNWNPPPELFSGMPIRAYVMALS